VEKKKTDRPPPQPATLDIHPPVTIATAATRENSTSKPNASSGEKLHRQASANELIQTYTTKLYVI